MRGRFLRYVSDIRGQKSAFFMARIKFDRSIFRLNKFKFDDINKLLSSGILSAKFVLYKNNDGDVVCLLKKDHQKAQESKEKIRRFKEENGQDNAYEAKDT